VLVTSRDPRALAVCRCIAKYAHSLRAAWTSDANPLAVVFGVHPPPVRLPIRITIGYHLKDFLQRVAACCSCGERACLRGSNQAGCVPAWPQLSTMSHTAYSW